MTQGWYKPWACVAGLLAGCLVADASPRRVVVIKLDGVPADLLEQVRQDRDPRTGNSKLPWIDEVFARQGTRIANFYVRGISLSAPSWSLLDTGQHQRWVRWKPFTLGLRQRLFKTPHDLFDELQIGFDLQNSVFEQQEQELVEKVKDDRVLYLDLFCGDFDHVAHRGNDRIEQTRALQGIDAAIGRIWTAIQGSNLRDSTVMVVVSDHGHELCRGHV